MAVNQRLTVHTLIAHFREALVFKKMVPINRYISLINMCVGNE